jgi:hypothetical protein
MPATKQKHLKRASAHATLKASLTPFLSFSVSLLILVLNVYSVSAAGLSFGYKGGDSVVNGMIVSVDPEDAESVTPAHTNNKDYAVGVAVDQGQSAVVIDNDDSVYVATEGTVAVFVSTVGGDIEVGDLITISAIEGLGRKKIPDTDGQKVIGVAKTAFNKDADGAQEREFDNAGAVYVGQIQIEILISDPATGKSQNDGTNVIVRIARRIAGKPVSLSQVIVTASVVIVAFVVSGALLYGAVRGSFTSIGRNPLSASTIYRGMARASLVSLSIMMLGIVGGYVVLLL